MTPVSYNKNRCDQFASRHIASIIQSKQPTSATFEDMTHLKKLEALVIVVSIIMPKMSWPYPCISDK